MDYPEFREKYHITLNEQQETAVQTIEGPCLLLAVPGSGKTTVLVNRLAYMIYGKDIPPENILVLTYTVAAAKDMSSRFTRLFGNKLEDRLEFRTINGICAKVILYYSHLIGRVSYDLESSEKDRNRRISMAYQMVKKEYPADNEIRDISTLITYIKNMMLTKTEIEQLSAKTEYPLQQLLDEYNRSLKQDRKMDYDDQMIHAHTILKISPETLAYFRQKYQYICVDEAQDTSKIQHVLISLLAGEKGNLFMVGDEDQSIYSFRAADPSALLRFEQDHPGAKVLLMETNFRSNANIVAAADAFIQKNVFRHKKTICPSRPPSSEITRIQVNGRAGQYQYLLNMARNCKEETAVLYRENESIIPVIDLFDRKGIPFRMKNAELSFFSHRISQDIIAIFRFILNPRDAESFMTLYYKLGLFMSRQDAEAICNMAAARNIDIVKAGMFYTAETKMKARFEEFGSSIRMLKQRKPAMALNYICSVMGYSWWLKQRKISDKKLDILKEIFSRCNTLEEGLQRLNDLQEIVKNASPYNDSPIIFSTIHSSKGLEYISVYLLDIIDGIFPDKIPDVNASQSEKEEYEEARRIFYVGATRAKDNLFLFRTGAVSTFVDELRAKKTGTQQASKTVAYEDYCIQLTPGRKVKHTHFGEGTITNLKIPFVGISFNGTVKTFGIKTLYEKNILSFS